MAEILAQYRFARASLAAMLVWSALATPAAPAQAALAGLTFTVTSNVDIPDSTPGDGVCETAAGNGVCTLRAAIQEANAHPGPDTIQLQPNTAYRLTRPGHDQSGLIGALVITDSATLQGAGPDSTFIDGNGAFIGDSVLDVFAYGKVVTISGVTIENGLSQIGGGGITNDALLTVNNSHILNNATLGQGVGGGGGIFTSSALTVTNSLISGNVVSSSQGLGGGILDNDVPMVLISSTVSSNHILTGTGLFGGGGIFGAARIIASTISGNTAFRGGGLFLPPRTSTVINSTISGNDSYEDGGGLYNQAGQVQLFNTTVADNRADTLANDLGLGGGVANAGGAISLTNSLIGDNSSIVVFSHFRTLQSDDCLGSVSSLGSNLVASPNPLHCTLTGVPATIANPLLGPLQANGGPTLTDGLLPGSPAIDAGDPAGCTDDLGAPLAADQRGAPRVANGTGATRCDLGAYEVQRLLDLPLVRR